MSEAAGSGATRAGDWLRDSRGPTIGRNPAGLQRSEATDSRPFGEAHYEALSILPSRDLPFNARSPNAKIYHIKAGVEKFDHLLLVHFEFASMD